MIFCQLIVITFHSEISKSHIRKTYCQTTLSKHLTEVTTHPPAHIHLYNEIHV